MATKRSYKKKNRNNRNECRKTRRDSVENVTSLMSELNNKRIDEFKERYYRKKANLV